MPCTVQQGAHICLVSPSNIDHQHACEKQEKRPFTFLKNYYNNVSNTENTVHSLNHDRECFTVRFIFSCLHYVSKNCIFQMAVASMC